MALPLRKSIKPIWLSVCFQKCIDLKYRDDIATVLIADIYRKAGNDDKMKEMLYAGLEKFPNSRQRANMTRMLVTPLLREAAEPFNEANALAKQAADGGSTDAYLQFMEKAVVKYKESIPIFEKILEYDPRNQQATTYLESSQDNIKRFEDYKASIKK
jgi:tetratricopeptide (TPR) repeat protein